MRNFLIFLILLAGFVVRVWGINFGLPQIQIIDEFGNLYFAFWTGQNHLRPLRYFYGPLVPYILLLEFGVYFIWGKLLGELNQASDFFISYLKDPTTFVLIGRVTMALFGTFCVYWIAKIGSKFYSRKVGLMSAIFLAFSFLHVRESHYIKEDVLASFFVLATFYFSLNILFSRKIKNYIFAGIFFTLALAAKYPSVLILPVIIASFYFSERKFNLKKIFIFGLAALVIFFITNPYFLIEFKSSIIRTFYESGVDRIVYPSHLQGKGVWWWFFFDHIPNGLGILFYLTSLLGFLVCFYLGRKEPKYLLIPIMPIFFLATIDLWSKYHFPRYAVMTLPFYILSAAILLEKIANRFITKEHRLKFMIFASLILISQSFLRVIRFDKLISSPDTRKESAAWIEKNIPPGSTILAESTIRPEYLSQLSTPIKLDEKSIERRIRETKERNLPGTYLELLKVANDKKIGYDIIATPRIDLKYDIYTSEFSNINEPIYYKEQNIPYLVLSSWATKPDIDPNFEKSILNYYDKITQFNPNPILTTDPLWVGLDYENMDKINPLDKDIIFGPIITIYKLKG